MPDLAVPGLVAAVTGVDPSEALRVHARRSGIRLRRTRLDPGWRRRDVGPLIGWHTGGAGDPVPVPLVFARGRYHVVDPLTRARTPVDPSAFADGAAVSHLPLPARARLRDLLRRGFTGNGRDLRGMLVAGVLVAVLHLATPVVIGQVLGGLVRGDPRGMAWDVVLYLATAVAAALLEVVLNLRALRFEDRFEANLHLALWDRLLRLPTGFFRGTTSGALANRVLGVARARQALDGVLARALLAVCTAGAGVVLLLVVESRLTLVGFGLVVGTALVSAALGVAVVRRQRAALPAEHHAASVTDEVLAGVTTIKTAAAEPRALRRWAEAAVAARAGVQGVRRLQAGFAALVTALPISAQLVLLAVLSGPLGGQVPADRFFTANAGLALLVQAAITLCAAGIDVAAALPRLEEVTDVLAAAPESEPGSRQVELGGEIEVRNVTFRYPGSGAPVLDAVSLHVRPGEFVALVGPSGSGKSTLLRLLLGFERPETGAVRYDGQDLAGLDVGAVRRQCGVVLQDGRLFGGTLRENICGADPLPIEAVWEAVRLAGLEEDVRLLPMGLHTVVPFGGGTLSVGQRQRVLIARALATKPRVLFFDEATSALDNRTQEIVTEGTRRSAATRVVVAHRLSTVRDADRIFVLDRGRVVQAGTFAELFADTDGLFHRLAARQVVGVPPALPRS
ncbi:ATP-binding cassette domain-containing protein [Actinosynnema sp. NPDC020468]|uniref:ATP-binding cassette domain-containing protein n=1 Tax=Actinosynnema sp. NPDC020468 TaxID=3154488 RepID=UPI0033D4933C